MLKITKCIFLNGILDQTEIENAEEVVIKI